MKKKVLQDKLLESSRCINPKFHKGIGVAEKKREKKSNNIFLPTFLIVEKILYFCDKFNCKIKCNLLMIK